MNLSLNENVRFPEIIDNNPLSDVMQSTKCLKKVIASNANNTIKARAILYDHTFKTAVMNQQTPQPNLDQIINLLGNIQNQMIQMNQRLDNIETDVRNSKTDGENIKTNVRNIKTDVENIKTDVRNIKTDGENIKTNVEMLNKKSNIISARTNNIIARGHNKSNPLSLKQIEKECDAEFDERATPPNLQIRSTSSIDGLNEEFYMGLVQFYGEQIGINEADDLNAKKKKLFFFLGCQDTI